MKTKKVVKKNKRLGEALAAQCDALYTIMQQMSLEKDALALLLDDGRRKSSR